MTEDRPRPRALVFETDPLVSERLRSLLRAEDFSVCAVDEWLLFRSLATQGGFALHAVSSALAEATGALELLRKLDPLWLLVSSADAAVIARFRMALPGASLLDGSLRDPDAVRRALGASPPAEAAAPPSAASSTDWVRSAFGGFSLSARQLEVLARALCGETSREIAARLYISEPTVRNHLHAIYERVGVDGRRELLGRFVRGIIDPGASGVRRAAARPRVTGSSGTR
jgi:DNA-binding NarL/FixJ family response regulator